MAKDSEKFSEAEKKSRLAKMLHGVFGGSPTPLKAIPKKNGESRTAKKTAQKAKVTRAKRR